MLVAIDGPDGAGKSTLVARLKEKVERSSARVVSVYRFPSETLLGKTIRKILGGTLALMEKDSVTARWTGAEMIAEASPLILQCAMTTDRYAIADEIKAKIAAGEVVILDRWWQSGFAYGSAFGLSEKFLIDSQSALPEADANILLDVSPEVAISRRPVPTDEYEKMEWLREKVRDNYMRLWNERRSIDPLRWRILNANAKAEEVFIMAWGLMVAIAQRAMMKWKP